jgi:mannose-6-phosphate isomerase-like protein (cupin superfamily)
MQKHHLALQDAIEQLQQQGGAPFSIMLQHGHMRVEYYAPRGEDLQTPHLQDELYIICSGSADLERNGETLNCKVHDVLFVPAGMPHRFINISHDFSTWVIFYGENDIESIH